MALPDLRHWRTQRQGPMSTGTRRARFSVRPDDLLLNIRIRASLRHRQSRTPPGWPHRHALRHSEPLAQRLPPAAAQGTQCRRNCLKSLKTGAGLAKSSGSSKSNGARAVGRARSLGANAQGPFRSPCTGKKGVGGFRPLCACARGACRTPVEGPAARRPGSCAPEPKSVATL